MDDLFRSKTEQFWSWLRRQELVRTSEIVRWGANNYCNDAPRLARKLREKGRLKRLTNEEMTLYGYGKTAEKIYRVIK